MLTLRCVLGMLTFKNEDAHAVVKKSLGASGQQELSGLDFLPFPDLEKAVEDDVKYLKASNAIPDSITVSVSAPELNSRLFSLPTKS